MNPDPAPRSFQTTHWSLVQRAVAGGDPLASPALAELCECYWYPIYAFIRRRGHSVEDAEDLTQSFFARLLSKDILAAADPEKGKLRTFLLTCLRRFLSDENDREYAQKRGKKATFSLDTAWAEERYAAEPASADPSPDRLFQRRWAVTVLEFALQSIAREFQAEGKSELFETLRPYLGYGKTTDESYAAAAARIGMPEGTLKSHVSRLRQRWREVLFEQVAITLDEPTSDNIRAELSELQEWL